MKAVHEKGGNYVAPFLYGLLMTIFFMTMFCMTKVCLKIDTSACLQAVVERVAYFLHLGNGIGHGD